MRRWSIRILAGLVLLIAAVVVVTQLVLWSSLPKTIVMSLIEKELGLRISADTLTTNWLGNSTLENVSLGLPLSKENFLGVKTLHIKHNTLLGLAIGNAIAVDSIEVDNAVVQVRQDKQGNFNLIEVAQLLARVLGSNTAKQSSDTGVPKLPKVKLVDATVHFSDNQGRTADLNNIQLNGYPADALVWKYDLKVADSIALNGELAPGGIWKHKVDLVAHNLQPLVQSYGIPTYGAVVKAEWAGQLDGDAVNGQLTLQQATATGVPGAKDISATGAIDVNVVNGIATIKPQRLDLVTGNTMLTNVEVSNGNIVYDPATGAHLNSVQLGAFGGLAVVDGQFNPATFAGNVHARWNGLALPGGITHSGQFSASLKTPFTGKPVINVDVESHGKNGSNTWDAKLNLAGIGESWKNIDWVLTAPQMQYVGMPNVQLANLTAHVSQKWPVVELVDVVLPGRPSLLGFGKYDGNIGLWNVYLDAGGVPAADPSTLPFTFSVDAWGNNDRIALKAFNAQVAQVTAWAGGYYGLNEPKPVHLDLFINQSAPPGTNAATAAIQGHAHGAFHVTGNLFDHGYAPAVDVSGKLDSNDLVVFQKPVGDIALAVSGDYHGKRIHFQTNELVLFQGRWNFHTDYLTDKNNLTSELDVDELPLDELAKFVNVQGINGVLTHAEWHADVPLWDFKLDDVKINSHYAVRSISTAQVPNVVINSVTADGTVAKGVVSLSPINIVSGTGKVDGSISMDLATHNHVLSEFHVHAFPVKVNDDVAVVTSADTKLDLNVPDREITGPLTATTDVNYDAITLVHAVLDSAVRGRTVTIKNLGGNVLNGTFQGNSVVDLYEPLQATGQFRWYQVDSAALVAVTPGLKGLAGKYSGTVTIAPAKEPRPVAPVRIDINVAADGGQFKTVKIGEKGLFAIHAVGYADIDRVILDHSDIHVAGGLVNIWARLQKGANAVVTLKKLDLNQLAHVVDNLKGPYPGQVDGTIGAVASAGGADNIIGNASIKITRSDLANFGPLAKLYAIANAGGSNAPIGYGTVRMNFEQKTLKVTEFHYFNRGIDAEGTFKVGPLAKVIPNTAVVGSVVGSAQILKGSRVQLFSDINDVFASAQGALAGVGVDGNVGAPHIFAASAAALGNSFQEIFTGDTTYETGKPPTSMSNP